MQNEKDDKKGAADQHKDASVQPDKKTLHTTDPEEHMEGPLSSIMQGIKKGAEKSESKEAADAEKDRRM